MWLDYFLDRNELLGPDETASVDMRRRLTHRELNDRSRAMARSLARAGIAPGERVGMLSRNSVDMFEAYMAISRAGAIAVPFNFRWTPPEIRYPADDSGITALFYEPELFETLGSAFDGMDLKLKVALGSLEHERLALEQGDEIILPEGDLDDPFAILYTSGTTGHPKGSIVRQRALRAQFMGMVDTIRMDRNSRFMQGTPLFHIGITVATSFLAAGGSTVFYRDFVPDEVLELMEGERVTHFITAPTVIQFLVQGADVRSRDLTSLLEIGYGAAPMRPSVLSQAMEAFGCNFRQVYGLTEGGGVVTSLDPADHFDEVLRDTSVGRPLIGFEVGIRDTDDEWMEATDWGEVCIKGESVMTEYWNKPDATAKAITDGWLRTGDVGWMDDQGYLYLVDRRNDMLISGGENVYPAEVEMAIDAIDGVEESAVIGIPDEKWGEVPIAFVVLVDGVELDEAAIVEACTQALARYKVPKQVRFIDELPKNQLGKILRRELRQQAEVV